MWESPFSWLVLYAPVCVSMYVCVHCAYVLTWSKLLLKRWICLLFPSKPIKAFHLHVVVWTFSFQGALPNFLKHIEHIPFFAPSSFFETYRKNVVWQNHIYIKFSLTPAEPTASDYYYELVAEGVNFRVHKVAGPLEWQGPRGHGPSPHFSVLLCILLV